MTKTEKPWQLTFHSGRIGGSAPNMIEEDPWNTRGLRIDPGIAFRVRVLISQALAIDYSRVDLDAGFEALGGDSILRISILTGLEAQYGVRIDDPSVRRFRTGNELAAWLTAHVGR